MKVRKCEVVLFSRERFSYLDARDETPQQQEKISISGLNDEMTMYMVWLESLGHSEHRQTVFIEFGCKIPLVRKGFLERS